MLPESNLESIDFPKQLISTFGHFATAFYMSWVSNVLVLLTSPKSISWEPLDSLPLLGSHLRWIYISTSFPWVVRHSLFFLEPMATLQFMPSVLAIMACQIGVKGTTDTLQWSLSFFIWFVPNWFWAGNICTRQIPLTDIHTWQCTCHDCHKCLRICTKFSTSKWLFFYCCSNKLIWAAF